MSEKSIKKNFSLSLAYQILTLITPFVTTPYISRVLEPDGVGITSYTASVVAMFALFAYLGVMSYGTIEIAKVRDNFERRNQLFWEIELMVIISSLVVMLAWGCFILLAKQYQLIYIILTLNIFNVLIDISWFYAGLEEFSYIVYRNFCVKIIGIILMFIFIREKNDMVLNIFIMSMTQVAGTLSMWFYLKGRVGRPRIVISNVFRHFRETLIYFIPSIASSIYSVLDKALIGTITHDAFQNGYYEQATKVAFMAKTVTFGALNSVMMSRQSYLFAAKKFDEMKQRIDKSIDMILFVGIGMTMGVIGAAGMFVPVFFGPGYEQVAFLMQLLIPVILFSGIGDCLGSQYYNPSGLRAKSARYIIVGAIVNLIFNLIFIPSFGSVGAVCGTLIAEFLIACLYVYNCNGYLRVGQIMRKVWKKGLAGVGMLFVIWLLANISSPMIIRLILQVLLGSIAYLIFLFVLRDSFMCYLINDVVLKKINSIRSNH